MIQYTEVYMEKFRILTVLLLIATLFTVAAEDKKDKDDDKKKMKSSTFSGLKLRLIGPAVTSGRIIDFAVNPSNINEFYVAVASGGVWKTTDRGTTFSPIFDNEGSYSIGCVSIDPNNHHVVWVGTGENNSQRSVSYGDGVYKSIDGGKSWKNMGLKESEHIGKILIDPRNSNIVYVAAQGPLWRSGDDRGLYKTTDAGKTWEKILEISENTGVSDLVYDPRDPDVLYCSSYQRRRHVWTLINGGPESAVYKSTDAGKTWDKLTSGLPGGYVGRIGLAISPVNPDILYALVEAEEDKGGFFRSTNRGATWDKRSDYNTRSAQYYQELFCGPEDEDIVFSVDTYTNYTLDGGKTFERLNLSERHVDDHALWINPDDTDHIMIGGDGGIYISYDRGGNWDFVENLPVTQFYRVTADNDSPFYSVYGGTQDNNTLGTYTRTTSQYGITNDDWIFTVGGDGFKTQIDPDNPDIIYSQPQYGWLVRYDRQSGEITGIQPQPDKDEMLRWNWNSPLIISPHKGSRLYFAANKLFKSEDRGNSWTKISGDLTRQIDRNKLPVMGKIWEPEAVAKNASTSQYGNIVSLTESTLRAGLLYIGTDDGLIQVTEDEGKTWTKYGMFPGVPDTTYVADIEASLHDVNFVYSAFDNRKKGDFKPYILKSTDKGKSWVSISGDLPENGTVHTLSEDHENSNLLFAGTEFGLFFTINGGKNWIQLKSGIPTICIKDIDVQRRENDLALASFGRGIYILDDYSPLRTVNEELLEKENHIFPVKDALMYIEDRSKGRRSQGANYYRGENHPFGAVFTYYIKEPLKTLKDIRRDSSKKLTEAEKPPLYPGFEELWKEDFEIAPFYGFRILDSRKNVIRTLKAPNKAGIQRIVWDLRYPDTSPVTEKTDPNKHSGMPVLPGTYYVEMIKVKDGKMEVISPQVSFNCIPLNNTTLEVQDEQKLLAFQRDIQELQRAVYGTDRYIREQYDKLDKINTSLKLTGSLDIELYNQMRDLKHELDLIDMELNGDKARASRNAQSTPGLKDRLEIVLYGMWWSRSEPTKTNMDMYKLIGSELEVVIADLKVLSNSKIAAIEKKMEEMKAPYTPGRLPAWKK